MKIISSVSEMAEYSRAVSQKGQKIGFVPTMGAFHEGHLSLMRAAKKECDTVVVSVFVNQLQFSPNEDFDKYPRDIEKDKKLASQAGVSVFFVPEAKELYSENFATYVEVTGKRAKVLCGSRRPGHFKGVTTVVAKLFNICCPCMAYFGQKDWQQTVIVEKMVRDLNIPVTIRVMPTVREKDGLAMSSRNAYLSSEERIQALAIYRSLSLARKVINAGEVSSERVRDVIKQVLMREKKLKIDYIEIMKGKTLEPIERIEENTLIAVSVFAGETRLIDNSVISTVSEV